MPTVSIDGKSLQLPDALAVIEGRATVSLSAAARKKMNDSRRVIEAMLRAGERLVLGGMTLAPESSDGAALAPFYAGKAGGLLRTFSIEDGSKLSELELESPPVWDGMAAAGRCLYVSTADGKVVCLSGR